MKRILALLMALCLCCATTVTVLAADSTTSNEVDYLNYEFPADAVVLYQGVDGVIYQSEQKSAELASMTSDMTFNYVDFPAGHWTGTKTFTIENSHWMPFTTTYGTFKIESDYQSAEVHMILDNGMTTTYADKNVSISNNDIHFEFKSSAQNLNVKCFPTNTSNVYGIRAMCWLY